MDLTLERVVEVYAEDLADKGIAALRPADPLHDERWGETLEQDYPYPFATPRRPR